MKRAVLPMILLACTACNQPRDLVKVHPKTPELLSVCPHNTALFRLPDGSRSLFSYTFKGETWTPVAADAADGAVCPARAL